MFKGHPKGLFVLFFTEMWERFGYYTVMAIFVYYLAENFQWSPSKTQDVYSSFIMFIYLTPLIGGWIADNVLGYGKTIVLGAITMMIGYTLMAIPTQDVWFLYIALAIVAIGNGLFKANISVLVGNLYSAKDSSLKDAAYSIFYMGINVGAFFAPWAATAIKTYFLDNLGTTLAVAYNAGFGVAAAGMVISLVIFLAFRKHYKDGDYQSKNKQDTDKDVVLTKKQEIDRVVALLIIFFIVIFFWMAFHHNAAGLAYFAKDYTVSEVNKYTYLIFDFMGLISILALIFSAVMIFRQSKMKNKLISAFIGIASIAVIIWRINVLPETNEIDPEKFQIFNPLFIVFLTSIIVGIFRWLNKKGKEPSSPAKIGIGMFITGLAFLIMVFASFNLPAWETLGGGTSSVLVSPYWLISTFFALTVAELCLSPMGLSLVSKVAPPKLKGLMMGGWFFATAIGNKLVGVTGQFYEKWEVWQFFGLLVITSFFSAFLVLLVLRKLRKIIES